MSQVIQSKIDAVRRKHAVVRAGFGVSTMVIVLVSVLAGTMLLDWWFDLPYVLRCAMLAIHVSALGYLLARHVIWPLIKGPDDETVALWIESFYEDAGSRLISAVQFSQPKLVLEGASKHMVGAAVRDAEAYIEPKDTTEVIAVDEVMKRVGVGLLLLVIGAGVLLYGRGTSRDLLMRAVCVPGIDVPRKTQVELLTPLKRVVAKGDAIRIEALARGVVPDEGMLRVRYDSGVTSDFYMKPDRDEPEKFGLDIENVQDSFSYRVYLNDGRSAPATIEAHPRPDVADIEIFQHLPAYTQRPPAKRLKSDLQILAGSRLQLKVTASKPVKDTASLSGARNRVKFEGTKVEYYLKRDPANPRILTTSENNIPSVPVPAGTTGMSIHLVDELGLESKDPAVYRIDLVPDMPPVVNLTFPLIREELVTERATTTIGFELTDDIAVAKSRIRHMPAGADAKLEGDGLTAQYFNNPELDGEPVLERVEPKIDFNFNDQQSPDKKVPRDNFSIRWTGKLVPPQTGTYVLVFDSDDGVRVWQGETVLIDQWGPRTGESKSEPLLLEAGKLVDIKIEYLEVTGESRCKMMWVRPDKRREVVPTSSLVSGDEALRAARMKRTSTIELDLPKPEKSVRGQYKWDLNTLKLQPGDVIEWWVEAEDGNDQTGPGRTESEHRTIRIGTEAQVSEYLLSRLGDPLKAIEEIQENQIDLTGSLGEIIFEKPGTKGNEPRLKP